MREIKFRGKAVWSLDKLDELNINHVNGWVYGNLVMSDDIPFIVTLSLEDDVFDYWIKVQQESVGQYTGMNDKNGTPIYEGDIVTGESFETSMLKNWKTGLLKHLDYDVEYVPEIYVVRYHEASFKTFNLKGRWVAVLNHHVSSMVEDLQVIGNIFENQELLEGEE